MPLRFRAPRTPIAALLVVLSSAVPLAPAAAQQATLTPQQQLAREVYSEMVAINTADSVGSSTKAAEALAKRFIAAGFPAADVQVLAPPSAPDKANLVVRYRGSGKGNAKPILLLGHLDVVQALRSDWTLEPFTLTERDGYFYGRGSVDDKAMSAILAANMLSDRRAGWVPSRDVILALTAAEEGGNDNGVEWLIAQHRNLIDAAYAINEGGGGALRDGRPLVNSVQAAEKVPVNLTLTTTNAGGHSSMPLPTNAIYQLSRALGALERFQFPVNLNEVTRAYFTGTAPLESPAIGAAMRAIVANPADSAASAVLSAVPSYNTTLRTTCVATRLSGGHAYNALPQTATANINCRVAPGETLEQTRATIARVIADSSIHITETVPVREKFGAAPSALTPELLNPIASITHSMWGAGVPVVPFMSAGATDGRFLRPVGIPTYGVSGIFTDPNDTHTHGRNERLPVKSFYNGQQFLDRLVHSVAGGAASK